MFTLYKVYRGLRHNFPVKDGLIIKYLILYFFNISLIIGEWGIAANHFIAKNTQRPYVYLFSIALI